jgi:hypothetical protein
MINIFSQLIFKDGVDYIYDCSITDNDLVCFTYGTSNGRTNMPGAIIGNVISKIIMDFPTLRDMMEERRDYFEYLKNYNIGNYIIKETSDNFTIDSKEENIVLPKRFLQDSYIILKNMWDDD